jgi:DNA-binding MarR family transcriptional regulator
VEDIEKRMKLFAEINEYNTSLNNTLLSEFKENLYLDLATNQMMLMNFVQANSGISIGQLAEKMKVTSSAVGQIITKLEENKLVERMINPKNRREINVYLTKEGEKYFTERDLVSQKLIEKYFSQLEMTELESLRDIVKKLDRIVNE